MSRYDLTPGAQIDLEEIWNWIAADNPARAVTFLEDLNTVFERLAAMPLIGRKREDIQRELRSFGHGSYLIFYRPRTDGAVIFRVVHARRDLTQVFDH